MTDTIDTTPPGVHIPLDDEVGEPEEAPGEDRFEVRRRDVRRTARRRRLRVLLGLVVAAAVVGALYGAFSLPPLSLQHFDIVGGDHVGPTELEAALGVEPGARLLSLDTGAVERRLERLPWIERADVMVRWPSTLRVRVRERAAAGVVVGGGAQNMAVADNGVVAGPVTADEASMVPVTVPGPVRRGQRLPSIVAEAVRTIGALPAPLAAQMSGATVERSGSIELQMRRDIRVIVGPPEQVATKFDALEAMLGSGMDLRGIRRIDVSVPSAVTMSSTR